MNCTIYSKYHAFLILLINQFLNHDVEIDVTKRINIFNIDGIEIKCIQMYNENIVILVNNQRIKFNLKKYVTMNKQVIKIEN